MKRASLLFFFVALLSATFFVVSSHTTHAATIGVPSNFLTLNTGLVGWWTFDGKDMISNVADKSGQGNNGRLEGQFSTATSTAVVPGKIGQAVKFAGLDDAINIGDIAVVENQPQLTISAWAKRSIVNSSNYYIISKQRSGFSSLLFGCTTSGTKFYYSVTNTSGTSGTATSDSSNCNNLLWHHIVGVYDGTDVKIYVDGVSADATPQSLTGNTRDRVEVVCFGASSEGQPTCSSPAFEGLLDDVRIYNRALSATEISQLYKMGSGGHQNTSQVGPGNLNSGLVGWWTFDGKDIVNGAMTDKSGNGNTGNFINIATSTFYVPGKVGQAGKFDGSNDYFQAPRPTQISSGSPWTVAMWAKANKTFATNEILNMWSLNDGTNQIGICYWSGLVSEKGMHCRAGTDVTNDTFLNSDPNIRKWHYWVMTHDGNNTNYPKIYVDGVENDVTGGSSLSDYDSNALYLSRGFSGTYYSPMDTDDVRIYNRALSAAEVYQLYTLGSGNHQNTSQVGPGNLNSGLVGWWTFDGKDTPWTSATAATTLDKSGNGNTGTLTNMNRSSAPVAGKVGQGLLFDGSKHNYINVVNSSSLNPSSITVSAWIKTSSTGTIQQINAKDATGVGRVWQFRVSATNVVEFIPFNASTNGDYSGSVVVTDGKWHFAVGTYDQTTTKVYVDGVADGAGNTLISGPLRSGQTNPVRIGADGNGGGGAPQDYFFGSLDDIRIYNRALSTTEIQQLYNQGR